MSSTIEPPRVAISVMATVYPARTMFLRETIGSGQTEAGLPIEVSVNVDGTLLVRVGAEGKWYAFGVKAMAEAVMTHLA